jgi:Protein of unknown function (DUF2628)
MTIYSIYARPRDQAKEAAVFVPQSFSWAAFVFGGLWALAHRMWIVGAILLAGMIAGGALPYPFGALLQLSVAIFTGIFAAELRGWSLGRAGFVEAGEVPAATMEEAEAKYFARHRAVATETWTDTLGLFGQQA